jgi:hypothetical protein
MLEFRQRGKRAKNDQVFHLEPENIMFMDELSYRNSKIGNVKLACATVHTNFIEPKKKENTVYPTVEIDSFEYSVKDASEAEGVCFIRVSTLSGQALVNYGHVAKDKVVGGARITFPIDGSGLWVTTPAGRLQASFDANASAYKRAQGVWKETVKQANKASFEADDEAHVTTKKVPFLTLYALQQQKERTGFFKTQMVTKKVPCTLDASKIKFIEFKDVIQNTEQQVGGKAVPVPTTVCLAKVGFVGGEFTNIVVDREAEKFPHQSLLDQLKDRGQTFVEAQPNRKGHSIWVNPRLGEEVEEATLLPLSDGKTHLWVLGDISLGFNHAAKNVAKHCGIPEVPCPPNTQSQWSLKCPPSELNS